jgi:hypothetical protein
LFLDLFGKEFMRKEMERDKNRVFSPSAGIPEIS